MLDTDLFITATTRLSAMPDCVDCPFGDGVAILHARTNQYFTLNAVGQHVWAQLAQPVTIAAIVQAVCAEFDTTPEVCKPDVQALIGELIRFELVRVD